MPIEAVYESLNGWLIQMPKIGCGLPGLLAQHHGLRIYEPAHLQKRSLCCTTSMQHMTGLHPFRWRTKDPQALPECVNHNLSLDTLYGINHHGNSTLVECLKALRVLRFQVSVRLRT